MKLMTWRKDGGPESRVWGFFVIELKRWFSIVILRFDNGTRDAYHSHAFNSVSWLLRGYLTEHFPEEPFELGEVYTPSLRPIITRRTTFHQVYSHGPSWVISFRGPWLDKWREYNPFTRVFTTLTHGRQEVA